MINVQEEIETITETFRISSLVIDQLEEKIEELNKRAKRLKCEPILFKKGELERCVEEDGSIGLYWHVEISGKAPRLNGWLLIAILEHTSEGNIIRQFPDRMQEEDLTPYRNVPPQCDHCHTNRLRNDTYVLRGQQGELKQVGSACLKDFTGHKDPLLLARMAELFMLADEACRVAEDDDMLGGSTSSTSLIDLETYLAYVRLSMRTTGWCSKKDAEMTMHCSTADDALDRIMKKKRYPGEEKETPSEKDRQDAKNAIAWMREFDFNINNKFYWNLYTICKGTALRIRDAGIAAALFTAYDKVMDAQGSEYQGEKDEKITVTVTVEKMKYGSQKNYGGTKVVTIIYTMLDQGGNCYVWYASKEDLEEKKTYTLTATVKDYKEYEGVKQTILTRCKVQK